MGSCHTNIRMAEHRTHDAVEYGRERSSAERAHHRILVEVYLKIIENVVESARNMANEIDDDAITSTINTLRDRWIRRLVEQGVFSPSDIGTDPAWGYSSYSSYDYSYGQPQIHMEAPTEPYPTPYMIAADQEYYPYPTQTYPTQPYPPPLDHLPEMHHHHHHHSLPENSSNSRKRTLGQLDGESDDEPAVLPPEEEEIAFENANVDDSDDDVTPPDVIMCFHTKMTKTKSKYRFEYVGLIIKLEHREYLFGTGSGQFEWV
eukprot:c5736_g2_i1.p1 GENE.c5736_g2_i1~~c5736_g2_i1.p1  ORF type:complete len:261 (+),score=47.23 c5736_g2_i1:1-783(+)